MELLSTLLTMDTPPCMESSTQPKVAPQLSELFDIQGFGEHVSDIVLGIDVG